MRTPVKHVAKDGTETWKVRFRLGQRQTSESFTDFKAAERFSKWLDALGPQAALDKLYAHGQSEAALTVDELAEKFFAFKETRVRSDRTVKDYRRDYRNWIGPTFGPDPVDVVTEVRVQHWVDAMGDGSLGKVLSGKSVADRHAILSGMFMWGIAPSRALVKHNPCIGTDLPAKTKKPPKGLRPPEWQALYAALRQIDPDGADLALFLLSTGWRISEGFALNADSVEVYGDAVFVSMDFVVRLNAAGQHVIVEDAKSAASEGRRAKLDHDAGQLVLRRLEKVGKNKLVFTNKNGRQWHYSNFLDRSWNPAVELAGLARRPTPHWLRHTHVFWMIVGGGADLPKLQQRVGHESIKTTIDVYGRMINDVTDENLAGFAAFRDQLPAVETLRRQVEGPQGQ